MTNEEVRDMTDADLEREMAFAEGFEPVTAEELQWLNDLRVERDRRSVSAQVTNLARLAKKAEDANAELRAAIVAERATGRTLEWIAQEIGWTKSGVLYVVRKAEKEGKG